MQFEYTCNFKRLIYLYKYITYMLNQFKRIMPYYIFWKPNLIYLPFNSFQNILCKLNNYKFLI
ncbi:hypothetical protein KSS87_017054 [Heliosperma pusillum]|nr:hypothetical protein KSS87_017054 [Heliosperma pusillum]